MTLSCFLMVRRTPDVTLIAPLFPFKTRLRAPVVCLSLGLSMRYLSVIVLIPLKGVFFRSSNLGWNGMIEVIFSPRVLAALRLSFGSALIGALINAVFGTLVAWVFVRSEEHTSELQSLMRISYAVFCLKKKKKKLSQLKMNRLQTDTYAQIRKTDRDYHYDTQHEISHQ